MSVEAILNTIGGLFAILVLLIFIFVLPARKKRANKSQKRTQSKQGQAKSEQKYSFEELEQIIKDPASTTEQLQFAVDQIVRYYRIIPPKIGIRPHPDFKRYKNLIMYLVRHKNTHKDIILQLDSALLKENPSYKEELDAALNKALNSR